MKKSSLTDIQEIRDKW